jgi:glycerol kinase
MGKARYVLAIDQGTTSTRAMIFDAEGAAIGMAQQELPQIYPRPGWVEHDAEEIWRATVNVCRGAISRSSISTADIASIGITNQRETVVLWDRSSGQPVHNAIVWQDRRTAEFCDQLRATGLEEKIKARTGLLLDPYFSATKLAWLLQNSSELRARAERGELAFGTIECFLLWRLTGGKAHLSDATNASRTMLYDIHKQEWDEELLKLLRIPAAVLPKVVDNFGEFGATTADFLGMPIPVTGMAGDQQAASIGQACFEPGMIKSTYGTGCFVLLNTGTEAIASRNRLLTTIAYRFAGKACYALEGSIFVAGAAVQWLRDGMKIIRASGDTETLAQTASPESQVYMVPAFTGLGAPYWDAHARGAILGLTRDTGIAEIARATLDAVCYQTRDLIEAMTADGAAKPVALRVDGGMVANDWLMQRLADMLDVPVERPAITETTALGAAFLAGLYAGVYPDAAKLSSIWRKDKGFTPAMQSGQRDKLYAGWKDAVARVRSGK